MPPLVERVAVLGEDNGLLPLLECFTSLAQALGVGFQPFAQPVFERCIRLIHTTLEADQMAAASQVDPPDKELLVCALDLISGMAEGLGASIEPLVASASASGVVLTTYLFECMKDPQADVRQSAFALVGDLARAHRPARPGAAAVFAAAHAAARRRPRRCATTRAGRSARSR